jgi:hypothetical protein
MKRAVLYLRVSTIDQTTANQERELREVASRMGCEIVRSTKTTASVVLRAGYGHRCSRASKPTVKPAGKRAVMMMLTAMPVVLSVALGSGSALRISRVKMKS